MRVERIVTGAMDENCYVIKEGKEVLVVDPGSDGRRIKEAIGEATLTAVLITHSHFDHVGALREIIQRTTPIYKRSTLEEKEYQVGPFTFAVLFTPGHSSDSVSFYFEKEKAFFSGDFLFRGSIGRCDLPTGDQSEMKKSLIKVHHFPTDVTIYPGHDEITTFQEEYAHNPYLK